MNRFDDVTESYRSNYRQWGYDEKTLFMPSDRRNIRYYDLLKNLPVFHEKNWGGLTLLDAGCGFGDVNLYLSKMGIYNYKYIGMDVVDEFLVKGQELYGTKDILFVKGNFEEDDLSGLRFDYAICSQTFNSRYGNEDNNYSELTAGIKRLFSHARLGVSFNFNTNKVDFMNENAAYHSPEKVLTFAYGLSHNVILDNSTIPFEATVTIFKDESFMNGVFNSFRDAHKWEFEKGIFVAKEKNMIK